MLRTAGISRVFSGVLLFLPALLVRTMESLVFRLDFNGRNGLIPLDDLPGDRPLEQTLDSSQLFPLIDADE